MSSASARTAKGETPTFSRKAATFATPVTPSVRSPLRGRGRPTGSFKVKPPFKSPSKELSPDVKRRPGRPLGWRKYPQATTPPTKKGLRHRKRRNKRAAASGAMRTEIPPAEVSDVLPSNAQNSNGLSASSSADSGSLQGQDFTCTHDFSIFSLVEMQRLAAASVAAAMRRSAEDPRFADHSEALQSAAVDLDSRALASNV
jgi:hypothetical protein